MRNLYLICRNIFWFHPVDVSMTIHSVDDKEYIYLHSKYRKPTLNATSMLVADFILECTI